MIHFYNILDYLRNCCVNIYVVIILFLKAIAVDAGPLTMLHPSFSREQPDQNVLDPLPVLLTSPDHTPENCTAEVYYARPVVQAKVNDLKVRNDANDSARCHHYCL